VQSGILTGMEAIGSRNWAQGLAKGILLDCDPARLVRHELAQTWLAAPAGILAIGKAAAGMATGAMQAMPAAVRANIPMCVMGPEERIAVLQGLPSTQVIIGDHPDSTARNQAGARLVLDWLHQYGPHGEILVLLSGGASAYLVSPMGDLMREELDAVYAAIRRSGGSIDELNAVRKHCETMKGGRLAGIAKNTRVLVMSDVLDDRLDVISSGPFFADSSTCGDAVAVLHRYELQDRFSRVLQHVENPLHETPKPGDARFSTVRHHILASNRDAVQSVASALSQQGVGVRHRIEGVRGQPIDSMSSLSGMIQSLQIGEGLVLGGEPTVDVRGSSDDARGGPSQEWCLVLAMALDQCKVQGTAWAFSTDGLDGNSPYAGGWLSSSMVKATRNRGLDMQEFRERHDASAFLEQAAGEIFTGPTGVNLNHVACVVRTA